MTPRHDDGTPPQAPAEGKRPRRRRLVRRDGQARAERIACTGCGSPIDVRDAQMAEMVSCPACGAVLDLESDDREVLAKILLESRPPQWLPLGSKGRFKGNEWEVVGRVRMKELLERWDEYLLYNPEHGYAWLQLQNGHWTFFRTLKNKPVFDPRAARDGQRFGALGKKFKVLYKGTGEIEYIEGEFPYQAAVGDRLWYMDAAAPPLMISAEWTDKELEWQLGMYVEPGRIRQIFALEKVPKRVGTGAAQPFEQSPVRLTLARFLLVFAAVGAALGGLAMLSGDEVAEFSARPDAYLHDQNPEGHLSPPIEIVEPGVVKVKMTAPVSNSWVYMEGQWLDASKQPICAFTEEMSYYHGYEGGESWSEGSKSDDVLFVVDDPGTYYLAVAGEGGTGETGTRPGNETVTVRVYEDVVLARYFFIAAALAAVFPAFEWFRRHRFEKARTGDDD